MGEGSVNNVGFDALEEFSRDLERYATDAGNQLQQLKYVAGSTLKVGQGEYQGMISRFYGGLVSQDAVTDFTNVEANLRETKKKVDDTITAWRAGEDTAHGRFAG